MNRSAFTDTSIDRVRDYWDRRPCNIRHSPAPIGTREYFDGVEARKYFVEPHIRDFAQHARWAGKRVLEIGCGIGTDTINFARAGAEVTAVDLSSRSLDIARQRADVYGLGQRIRFIEANAEQLSDFVAPEPYDLVYSFGVIHHSPRPERVLREVRAHFMAADSLFRMMVYHRRSWKVLGVLVRQAHGAVWRLDREIARASEAQTGCPVTYTYTADSITRLLTGSGFVVDDLFVDHIFPYRVNDYVEYRYVKTLPFRWLPAPVMRTFERRLGWHLCVTARADVSVAGTGRR
jgi:SAM-dependent methyltransferase